MRGRDIKAIVSEGSMTIEHLRVAQQTRPFRPFTIHMADGRSFHIRHNEFLSHSPSGRTVIVYQNDDSFAILDILLMTELAFPATAPAAQ